MTISISFRGAIGWDNQFHRRLQIFLKEFFLFIQNTFGVNKIVMLE